MRIVLSFLISISLAALFSFAAPVVLVGTILGFLLIISYLPGLAMLGNTGAIQVLEFLAVFGNGKPVDGILILGLTVSIVGILLDMVNFYRYQILRD
ncbi:MAG: hypothetical protein Tsb0014_29430 [Pleurocapsa sp.]